MFTRSFLLILALGLAGPAVAQDTKVAPAEETAAVQEKGIEGPTETTGVESIEKLGAIALGQDFEAMDGRSIRIRRITVLPGAVVGAHEHHQRPGVAYILEGEMTEMRPGADPVVKKAGETAFEESGVIHWWRNDSGKKAVVLVVDIVTDDQL